MTQSIPRPTTCPPAPMLRLAGGGPVRPGPTLKQALDAATKQRIQAIFDASAPRRARLRRANRYYHAELLRMFRFIVPEGARVLEVGCGDGQLLRDLKPSCGLGIDLSGRMIGLARRNAPPGEENLRFEQADVESVTFAETFDYIILSDLLGNLLDIQQALENLRSACHEGTRIVINYHGILWEPLLRLCAQLGLKMPQHHQNWISHSDVLNFLNLTDFEIVTHYRRLLLPRYVPLLSGLLNRLLAPLPLLNRLCLANVLVLRMRPRRNVPMLGTSVVIPCRNERGNIRQAVERLPEFGRGQEIIFVDGHSTDGTVEEIQAVIRENPHKDIRLYHQEGRGKGDAVRLGFERARHPVLMILDADLTVPPEELPKFYNAVASGKAEFANGSRLVYAMEKQAMRLLNLLGNRFFASALSRILGQSLKDTLCGTKVLTRESYRRIAEGRPFYGDFDPFGDFDLLFGAAKQGLKIVEVPIRYRDRTYGATNIQRFRHGWLLLRMTLFALRKHL